MPSRTCMVALLWGMTTLSVAAGVDVIELKLDRYNPGNSRSPITRGCNQYIVQHPHVRLKRFLPLAIPGGGLSATESTKLMSFAAETAPDLVGIWYTQVHSYVRNRFVMDLSAYIGADTDGDGLISDAEAIWPGWRNAPARFRSACTIDGKPYAVPMGETLLGLVYRRDMLQAIFGRSRVKHLPKDWDEFYYLCQKATRPQLVIKGSPYNLGQRGLYLDTRGPFWNKLWNLWLWSAGGNLVEQGRRSPSTGQWHWFAKEAAQFIVPETGEDLAAQPVRWRAAFGGSAGMRAMELYGKLAHAPWIEDPRLDPETKDHEPIDLEEEDVRNGHVILPDGRRIDFDQRDVRRGVVTGYVHYNEGPDDLLARGEAVFAVSDPVLLMPTILRKSGISTEALGFMPVPRSGDAGSGPAVLWECGWFGLNYQLGKSPGKCRTAFELLGFISENHNANRMRQMVQDGIAAFARPAQLEEAGYFEYVDRVPRHLVETYEHLDDYGRASPTQGFWQVVEESLIGGVITRTIADASYDWRAGLAAAEEEANNKVLTGRPQAVMDRYRRTAWLVFLVFVAGAALLFVLFLRAMRARYLADLQRPGTLSTAIRLRSSGVMPRLAPWLLIGPAVGLIALWAYYPMIKGSVMSFQDYRIVGPSAWVGIDNYISIVVDPKFYKYLWITAKFAICSLVFSFLTPIALGILLNEVPRGKFLFRMAYLLPQVCAGLVIVYLWKMLFHPTETGFFNKLILGFDRFADTAGGNAVVKLLWPAIWLLVLLLLWRLGRAVGHWLADTGRLPPSSSWAVVARWAPCLLYVLATIGLLLPGPDGFAPAAWWSRPVVFGAQEFYNDPNLALVCCVLPGAWAGAGMSSLIYLAALKSVPDELYEAAEVDGAGLRIKLFRITLPMLKPLVIINFIGAFIGTFHTMGNIFVMTGGGPGDDTTVLALAIWKNAFVYLQFGVATATAWVLGVMLIGFTVWQLRFLQRVEFRRAEW